MTLLHIHKDKWKPKFITFILLAVFTFSCNKTKTFQHARPNILFCIADDAGMFMSAYGSKFVNTPSFDKVAKNGLLFMNAYTPIAASGPSRSVVLTGRNPWELEQAGREGVVFPSKFKTYVEALNEQGYLVGYTGRSWDAGDPGIMNNQPRKLTGKSFNKFKMIPPTQSISSDDYSKNFEYFLSQQKENEPWAFWYGSREPHRNYTFRSGVNVGGKSLSDIKKKDIYKFLPDNDTTRHDLLDYATEMEYSDHHLGKMLDLLHKTNQLDNTIVIVTSDNGIPFPRVKGMEYERSIHLPLAIMWGKGINNPGRVINDYISFTDIAPTILEVANISSKSKMEEMSGKSFTDIFYTDREGWIDSDRNYILIGKEKNHINQFSENDYPVRGLVMDNYLYLQNYKNNNLLQIPARSSKIAREINPTYEWILKQKMENLHNNYWDWAHSTPEKIELYDIHKDPDCLNNLSKLSAYQKQINLMSELMTEKLKKQNDPRMLKQENNLKEDPKSQHLTLLRISNDSNRVTAEYF
ncbi:sulfatase-like hydrolase/transferase [Flammeovirga yaeyamensis]|uniref:Sulfatase-like hydrolase/transferase n=1 Tax=Flammeovirga yaeyamensis TaxID=367791 RepID=A0AAX1NDM8_9BACT|nr:sulfatase [Flammeovirga yaeyamensis]MBB3696995.1 arylsulfatase A-like enzyme [Flammeovirga yaeyamensis]NMF33658.1 sulfatase [Flammeovirga yaeyamensis]QWG05076.1 sulfatase-like hydrolase/transferase [Flammeovirga yaeyamensis]